MFYTYICKKRRFSHKRGSVREEKTLPAKSSPPFPWRKKDVSFYCNIWHVRDNYFNLLPILFQNSVKLHFVHSFYHLLPFIHSFIHSSIHSFICSFIRTAMPHWPGIKHIILSPNDEWRLFLERYSVLMNEFKPGWTWIDLSHHDHVPGTAGGKANLMSKFTEIFKSS